MAMVMRITMMVRTTINSTKVKPRARRNPDFTLPLRIRRAIRACVVTFTINVEDVLAAPTLGRGIVLVATHPPLGFPGERIARDVAEELHLGSVGVVPLGARDQDVQGFGIPIGALLDRAKIADHVEVVVLIRSEE